VTGDQMGALSTSPIVTAVPRRSGATATGRFRLSAIGLDRGEVGHSDVGLNRRGDDAEELEGFVAHPNGSDEESAISHNDAEDQDGTDEPVGRDLISPFIDNTRCQDGTDYHCPAQTHHQTLYAFHLSCSSGHLAVTHYRLNMQRLYHKMPDLSMLTRFAILNI
jgi:hypothetical protein